MSDSMSAEEYRKMHGAAAPQPGAQERMTAAEYLAEVNGYRGPERPAQEPRAKPARKKAPARITVPSDIGPEDLFELLSQGPLALIDRGGLILGPEAEVSAEILRMMKALLKGHHFKGFFTAVNNESEQRSGDDERTIRLRQHKKKYIGGVPGTPDWIFGFRRWDEVGLGFGGIELKKPGGSFGNLSNNQRLVRAWFKMFDLPWALQTSPRGVFDQLVAWGALHPETPFPEGV